ncbi:MAG: right-handed parallel beta-helix repeat-containing protein [Thermoplasmatales archaeon]|nr:MAG: right-handed parallel beta-helix repeat-containing protein [Thermoplasmatales archaeon]
MERNNLIKEGVVVAVILLFVSVSAEITTGTNVLIEKSSMPIPNSNILYVGGNGTGNYSKIQDAIDNASDGNTVFVYDDSSPYYENLNVSKSINLIGEDRDTTVINGSGSEIVVNIFADGVIVSGFTIVSYKIINTTTNLLNIQSDYTIIANNIFNENTSNGINIYDGEYNTIFANTIICNSGIVLYRGKNNNISGNIIKDCIAGIVLVWYSNNNSIFGNTLTNNMLGIKTGSYCINDVISLNNISYNFYGIIAMNCFNYKITKNNFIDNLLNARFAYSLIEAFAFGFEYKALRDIRSTINWDGNYWNKPRSFPKPILGRLPPSGYIPWVQFDWHPAQEPNDIGG